MNLLIRPATPDDVPVLVAFNSAIAWETEDKRLDPTVLTAGVRAVFDDPARGFYTVAERNGEVVGQVLITFEWSDWRNGWFWWIQSVYVREDARRRRVPARSTAHDRAAPQPIPALLACDSTLMRTTPARRPPTARSA